MDKFELIFLIMNLIVTLAQALHILIIKMIIYSLLWEVKKINNQLKAINFYK
jgi:hypothetical protein